MSKVTPIITYLQIIVIVCLTICNDCSVVNLPKRSDTFPCKGHQCGCKSEYDCKTHCCCGLYKNHDKFQNHSQQQKNVFHAFVSSVNCKYGNNPLTSITFAAKYILDDQVQVIKELFMGFLLNDTSITPPDPFVSPPKKPPRYFA